LVTASVKTTKIT